MFTKFKKKLLIPLSTLAIIGIAIIPNSKVIIQKSVNGYWYNNLNNEKFDIREQSIITESLSNGYSYEKPINNNYELKLLLNPGFESENTVFIQQFNKEFVQKVVNSRLKFMGYITSRIMPIIFFYFENEKDRENFVNKIKDFQETTKIIIFKNELKEENTWGNDPGFEYYRKTYSNLNIAPTKTMNNFKESIINNIEVIKGQGGIYINKVGKIGILEVSTKKFNTKYNEFFKSGIKVNESGLSKPIENNSEDEHATNVAMIAAGQFGVDRSSTVYLSKFDNYGSWQTALEKMVLEDGVRLINHSYGLKIKNKKTYYTLYSDDSYYLDYISRKYGVINLISVGNDGNDPTHQITGKKLSFNSIIVGALGLNPSSSNVSKNRAIHYTNYQLDSKYSELAKPLIIAPGVFYNMYYKDWMKEHEIYAHGTSYATPLVTGFVSNFLKIYSDIDSSEFRVPIIKSILSASSITPNLPGLTYKSSGYEQRYGAGTPDGIKFNEAAQNYRTIKVSQDRQSGIVLTSGSIYLNTNQTIKISSSWMFNAGILKENEKRPQKKQTNWWNSFFSFFSPSKQRAREAERRQIEEQQKVWDKTHLKQSESQLTFTEAFRRQDGNWFTNYDLILEYKQPNGNWSEIKRVETVNSNDELIEYKAIKSGLYRYVIKKISSFNFRNNIDDLIAVTHVVRDE
ncbi:serine protease [Mycoplasmopsis bovirhinis]|uniref:S8 family serine peptidase n=1 Tax=Mycoplasmopsis bovirhinis TaxID=29553 RepID=UPI000BB9EEAB|nr:S8 family serine peptidase [Mycoplasmopsis bovirhinis]BBA22300.1 serine protease [Mycoplasmopsis bovirhinis]